jgi:UDP-N-acetylglucosamine/UDP-N-acetylgalactosamine diphosphorylase
MQTRFAVEREKAQRHRQLHIFKFWYELTDEQKLKLLADSEKIDYGFVNKLFNECIAEKKDVKFSKLEPPLTVSKYPHSIEKDMARKIGEEAIKRNEHAVFLVAGGQGSRLGFEGPKGCYPGTPIMKKPLFQTFAEKIRAAEKKFIVQIEWFIMTSEENRIPTEKFFEEHNYFGLSQEQIHFFTQESLPAVDRNGKIMMKSKHEIFFSPNGTGGIYKALENSGMLDIMKDKDIKYLSYVQIDNALSHVVDPIYLGDHILTESKITPKVIPKSHAHEPIGLVVKANGVQQIIEYIVLSKEDAEELDETGELKFRLGSTGKMLLSVDFIDKVRRENLISFAGSLKKVPHIDEEGNHIVPEKPNAYKFESFVFDPMPHAKTVAFEVRREEEFAPIKNATGTDSPETSYAMQNQLHKSWMINAGIKKEIVDSLKVVEISPLFALDEEEFKEKVKDKIEHYNKILESKESYYFE